MSGKAKERDERMFLIARQVMAMLYVSGDEKFVGECVHGIVMQWLDERVIDGNDPRLDVLTETLGDLSGEMAAKRLRLGLDPTKVDP